MLAELVDGWNAFRSRTWLWTVVLQFAAFNALSSAPFMIFGAIVARDRLGGAAVWGAILALLGAATRMHPRRSLVIAILGAATYALPIALIAIPAPAALIAAGAAIAGVGGSTFGTLWETTLQQHVPSEVLSRVSAYDWFGSAAFVPVGYMLAAPFAAILGVHTALFFAAAWALASCAAVLLTPSVRNLTASVAHLSGQVPPPAP